MKRFSLLVLIGTMLLKPAFSQKINDSLVYLPDLKFHSEFEKNSITNFVRENKGSFDLFLAIDDEMTAERAASNYNTYLRVFDLLAEKKVDTKSINPKIKLTYSTVHSRFLSKYEENVFFSDIFRSGIYNCVTATMLYSLVFDSLQIPYKIMVSSNHVYLIANPGKKSVVIETTNPGFEKAIFTGEFKQQYVNYLRSSKLISEQEYKSKSMEEIFEEKFNAVKEADFRNLFGFQYYNHALTKIQNNEYKEGYELCQKAFYFYPDQQVKALLYGALVLQLSKCKFDKVNDMDYLSQLSRFEEIDISEVTGIFNNIVSRQLQYTNREAFCDSLYQRLISQVIDKTARDEISFTYNMQMCYRYQNSDKVEPYIERAIKIKSNHKDAINILTSFIYRKLSKMSDNLEILDTLKVLEARYNSEEILQNLKGDELIVFLKLADESFRKNNSKTGENYLKQFEDNYNSSFDVPFLSYTIESTYHSIAIWYYHANNKPKSKYILNQGLKYVPNSSLIKSSLEGAF